MDKGKYEWVLPVIKPLADTFAEHGKGFVVIPFAHNLEEAKDNLGNGEVAIMMTDLDDPTAFMGALTFALHTYCKRFHLNEKEMAQKIVTALGNIPTDEPGMTHIIDRETNKEVEGKQYLTIDADMVKHPERYNKKTLNGQYWGQFAKWQKDLVKHIEDKCDDNDASYTMVISSKEDGKGHAYSTAGDMKPVDLLASIASLMTNVVNRSDMDLDDCVETTKRIAEMMLDNEGDDNE